MARPQGMRRLGEATNGPHPCPRTNQRTTPTAKTQTWPRTGRVLSDTGDSRKPIGHSPEAAVPLKTHGDAQRTADAQNLTAQLQEDPGGEPGTPEAAPEHQTVGSTEPMKPRLDEEEEGTLPGVAPSWFRCLTQRAPDHTITQERGSREHDKDFNPRFWRGLFNQRPPPESAPGRKIPEEQRGPRRLFRPIRRPSAGSPDRKSVV